MSTDKKRGLGMGLGALIPSSSEAPVAKQVVAQTTSTPVTELGAVYAELPIGDITPNPRQPRTVFEEEALNELVYSIKEIGLLQPIVVRRVGGKYELVAGERRWRASQLAGLTHIPAIIRETADDDLLRDALLENLHRAQLNALEEAAAYQQLLDDFGCTQEELAARIGRSRPQVTNTLRLLRLPPNVQRRVAAGVLSAGHARALLGLPSHEAMEALALRIVAEGLSVRTTEELVALGGGQSKEKKQKVKKPKLQAPGLQDLADRMTDRLDTRVKVEMGKTKGIVSIEFATMGDLRRIVDLIDRD